MVGLSGIIKEKDSIPDTGLKGLPQNKFQALSASGCLQVFLPPSHIGFRKEIFAENETEWTAWCCGGGLAVEMFCEVALEIGGEAYM